jgi:hypothetical protein
MSKDEIRRDGGGVAKAGGKPRFEKLTILSVPPLLVLSLSILLSAPLCWP